MMSSPIISPEWLAERLLDPSIKIIEVSAKKGDEAGYTEKHIPGAFNFWWKDLCWHETDRQFVTPKQLAERLGNIGISDEDTQEKFGFLMNAFRYGAPPHGGMAFGLDRIVMLLAGSNQIRDVIAFPKTTSAMSLMDNSPSPVDGQQLSDLHLSIVEDNDR